MYEVQGLCVDVKYLILGSYENNVYIISDGKGTMVVDPSCQPKKRSCRRSTAPSSMRS